MTPGSGRQRQQSREGPALPFREPAAAASGSNSRSEAHDGSRCVEREAAEGLEEGGEEASRLGEGGPVAGEAWRGQWAGPLKLLCMELDPPPSWDSPGAEQALHHSELSQKHANMFPPPKSPHLPPYEPQAERTVQEKGGG